MEPLDTATCVGAGVVFGVVVVVAVIVPLKRVITVDPMLTLRAQ